jgi:hypothetical protein|tara:strand:+ start:45 stop:341 length:297 start_codon:yes stop_codon:yes gene_type:complete
MVEVSNPPVRDHLYRALEDRFEAQKSHAIATLELSFSRPVAIGEHPQLLDDMAKLVSDVATAEENLAALRDNFGVKAYPEGVTAQAPVENPDASHIKK